MNQEEVHVVYVCVGKTIAQTAKIVQNLEAKGAMPFTTVVVATEDEPVSMQ